MLGKPSTTELQSQPQKVVNVEIVKQFFSANTLSSCREGYAYPVLSIGVTCIHKHAWGICAAHWCTLNFIRKHAWEFWVSMLVRDISLSNSQTQWSEPQLCNLTSAFENQLVKHILIDLNGIFFIICGKLVPRSTSAIQKIPFWLQGTWPKTQANETDLSQDTAGKTHSRLLTPYSGSADTGSSVNINAGHWHN